jgi:hypothetical protein
VTLLHLWIDPTPDLQDFAVQRVNSRAHQPIKYIPDSILLSVILIRPVTGTERHRERTGVVLPGHDAVWAPCSITLAILIWIAPAMPLENSRERQLEQRPD